mmetsp:Transcript_25106/g.46935  ORF Transcript_25106/g.46935 Transcript_25106/m.46935 type:complete len:144 (+) Transcript_25106:2627-3058(+)
MKALVGAFISLTLVAALLLGVVATPRSSRLLSKSICRNSIRAFVNKINFVITFPFSTKPIDAADTTLFQPSGTCRSGNAKGCASVTRCRRQCFSQDSLLVPSGHRGEGTAAECHGSAEGPYGGGEQRRYMTRLHCRQLGVVHE